MIIWKKINSLHISDGQGDGCRIRGRKIGFSLRETRKKNHGHGIKKLFSLIIRDSCVSVSQFLSWLYVTIGQYQILECDMGAVVHVSVGLDHMCGFV